MDNLRSQARQRRVHPNTALRNSELMDYFRVARAEQVIWSHATNSAEKLATALAGQCHMIEADILMGNTSTTPFLVPIMAHPPHTSSNLSFEEFALTVRAHNKSSEGGSGFAGKKKGIKLDFKSPEAVVDCLKFLRGVPFDAPVWINADIWRGPGKRREKCKFDPEVFFKQCKEYAPAGATLSVGWTVQSSYKVLLGCGGYSMKHISRAIQDIERAYPSVSNRPRITFPMQAILARQTPEAGIEKLLQYGSITLWGEARPADMEWAVSLQGIVFIDVNEPGWKATYLVTYFLASMMAMAGMVAISIVYYRYDIGDV